MPPTPVLIIVLFVVVAGLLVIHQVRRRTKRSAHDASVIRDFGFTVRYPGEKAARDEAHAVFKPFKSLYLTKRAIRVVARRGNEEPETIIAATVMEHRHGETAHTMIARRAEVPRVEIAPRGVGRKLLGALGMSEAPITRGELGEKRSVKADDPIALERLATEEFQSAILAGLDDEHWALGDGWIRLCRKSPVSTPIVEHLVRDMERVTRTTDRSDTKQAPDRVPAW